MPDMYVDILSAGVTAVDVIVGGPTIVDITGVGMQGPKGDTGTAATVAVGTTTTGAPGTNANVTNSGSTSAAVFNFTIPQGVAGPTGPQGPQGAPGAVPEAPTDGALYARRGSDHTWQPAAGATSGTALVPTQSTAPTGTGAQDGSLWWDDVSGQLYIFYDDASADPGQWVAASNMSGMGAYLPLSGGSVTGDLSVGGNTTLQATTALAPAAADNSARVPTTAWVTSKIASSSSSITISDTAPSAPVGSMWFDSVGLQTYLNYNDGNSTQWTPIVNQTSGVPDAPATGQVYGRNGQASSWVPTLPLTGGTISGSPGSLAVNMTLPADAITGSMLATQVGGASFAYNVYRTSGGWKYLTNGYGIVFGDYNGTGAFGWWTVPSGTAGNAATPAQTMTLDGSGNLQLAGQYLRLVNGSGSINATGGPFIYADSSSVAVKCSSGNVFFVQNYAGTTSQMTLDASGFLTTQGYTCRAGTVGATTANRFNISFPSSAHLWIDSTDLGVISITSDYRIKKDVTPLPSMWERTKALHPISYTQAEYHPPHEPEETGPMFPADDIERWGFIAHELQETLIPSAATGVKDQPDVIQSPNPWTVIATLTKALQEAMERIEALEAAHV